MFQLHYCFRLICTLQPLCSPYLHHPFWSIFGMESAIWEWGYSGVLTCTLKTLETLEISMNVSQDLLKTKLLNSWNSWISWNSVIDLWTLWTLLLLPIGILFIWFAIVLLHTSCSPSPLTPPHLMLCVINTTRMISCLRFLQFLQSFTTSGSSSSRPTTPSLVGRWLPFVQVLLFIYPYPYITIDVSPGFVDGSPSVPCGIISEVPLVLLFIWDCFSNGRILTAICLAM